MVDGRTLLGWADRDDARRRGGRPSGAVWVALAIGVALAALPLARARTWDPSRLTVSTAYLVAVALVAMVPPMLLAPHRMFWRHDAAMVARLPIPGAALWRVAIVRAIRAAALGAVTAAPTVAIVAFGEPLVAARAGAVLAALALVAALLVPATCLAAAHVVASGQAAAASRALSGQDAVASTAFLGALPGAVMAGAVLAVAATSRWIADGNGHGAPLVLAGLAAASGVAAIVATTVAPRVFPLAMREVAGLDRQIMAHLEIHRATAIERAVAGRLGDHAGLAFDRLARLARRRYPLFALAGAAAAVAIVAVGLARPADADAWLAITIGAALVVAGLLARVSARPPLELARVTAVAPVAPSAAPRARRALVATWMSVWTAAPTAIAIAASPAPRTTAIAVGLAVVAGAIVGGLVARRR